MRSRNTQSGHGTAAPANSAILRLRASALLLFFLIGTLCVGSISAKAQGDTTSAIFGQVTDATSAAIPGATISVINRETGLRRAAKTDQEGRFNFAQLPPGTYSVKAEADGFEPQHNDNLASALGQKQELNFRLNVAHSEQNVQVSGEAPLLNPANTNTSSTLSGTVLADIPNPGADLTYPLQFASGALINTAGNSSDAVSGSNGYGNVEFNGLPAASNGYIVDGLETNDPLTNLNIGLATNLVLGLNSIAEVTVNTLSYSVDQGRYGASQVNYVTKSGTNEFHGNAYEIWNGAALNAADYFTNATPGNQKPQSSVNHFGGSLGGPILHDKLFFFSDFEWMRLALPIVTPATVPTPAFQNYVLQQLPLGGIDSVTGSSYPAAPQLVPFYQKMFSLYGNTSGTPLAVLGCPFNAQGLQVTGNPPNGNGCANRQIVSHTSKDHEQVQTVRMDYNIDANDTAWFRFQADTGLQAQYTDPINSLFNSISSQPQYTFGAGYTHVFSQNLVNYFNPGFTWYASLFGPSNYPQTLAAFPIVLQGQGANAPFSNIGGQDNTWVQGRRASRFFINDNLAWTRGGHELRFGANTRILRLNDYDFGEGSVPTVTYTTLPQFIYGVASTATETFPASQNEPFNFLNLDFYVQDTWKVAPKLTWTIGIRDSFNSNPANPHNQVARLGDSFDTISHDVNQPLNAAIQTQPQHSLRRHAAGHSPTEDRNRLAVCPQHRAANWLRNFQRHSAGQRGRRHRNEPALRPNISGRSARARWEDWPLRRECRTARSMPPGPPTKRLAQDSPRANFPARRRKPILLLVFRPSHLAAAPGGTCIRRILWSGASGIEHQFGSTSQRSRAVRRHSRLEHALSHASKRLPDRLPGLLRSVSLSCSRPIPVLARSPSSPPAPTATTTACNSRPPSAWRTARGHGQLQFQPLHGHRLERRIPSILRRRDSFAPARRSRSRLRTLRLRHSA